MELDHCGEFSNDAKTNFWYSQNYLQFFYMCLVTNSQYVLAQFFIIAKFYGIANTVQVVAAP